MRLEDDVWQLERSGEKVVVVYLKEPSDISLGQLRKITRRPVPSTSRRISSDIVSTVL